MAMSFVISSCSDSDDMASGVATQDTFADSRLITFDAVVGNNRGTRAGELNSSSQLPGFYVIILKSDSSYYAGTPEKPLYYKRNAAGQYEESTGTKYFWPSDSSLIFYAWYSVNPDNQVGTGSDYLDEIDNSNYPLAADRSISFHNTGNAHGSGEAEKTSIQFSGDVSSNDFQIATNWQNIDNRHADSQSQLYDDSYMGDFLVATTGKMTRNNASGKVRLNFQHKSSRVVLKAKADSRYIVKITRIRTTYNRFEGAIPEYTSFDLFNDKWYQTSSSDPDNEEYGSVLYSLNSDTVSLTDASTKIAYNILPPVLFNYDALYNESDDPDMPIYITGSIYDTKTGSYILGSATRQEEFSITVPWMLEQGKSYTISLDFNGNSGFGGSATGISYDVSVGDWNEGETWENDE